MQTKTFTPSINIIRDFKQEINYRITPNASQIYNQIVSNYQKGSRSFNIVGSFGTGKSAFILALEQTLTDQKSHFDKAQLFSEINKFHFINIVGDYKSLITSVANEFNIEKKDYSNGQIIGEIKKYYESLKGDALVIVIDEFGKFLEFAAKNNPEKELYFIQQLAELANDKVNDILFITILHKNFNAYSLDLTKSQVDEWNKVKGRFVELNFNEPVEQLLFLASEILIDQDWDTRDKVNIKGLFNAIKHSKLYPLRDYNKLQFAKKIYPFDLLSAAILTLSLQEYAQNERSLFSFIENDDEFGLKKYDSNLNPYFNLGCTYDYLNFYHFSFLSTKFNPHLNQWNAIKYAIERTEAMILDKVNDAIRLIKTIGLLNIFSKKGGFINKEFIEAYGTFALGIENPLKIIEELERQKIIHFTKYDQRFKILQGTDVDFELAINDAGNLVERIKDITLYLNKYFDFPIITAKKVSYDKGTPRLFSFIISDEPIKTSPEEEIDGFINLIFNSTINEKEIREHSLKCNEAILFGWYTQTEKIENILYEIEKINKAIEKNTDDLIAVQELNNIRTHYNALLNHYVLETLYSSNESIKWFFNGKPQKANSQKEFNNLLSTICNIVYPKTPKFKNELVNKTHISATISLARKNLLSHLLNNQNKPEFGFESESFPPEKTIYLSLIKSTGIYHLENDKSIFIAPTEQDFKDLWDGCETFLDQSIGIKKNISELIIYLKQRPFKLKQGFIDFWLPIFLIANKEEFALFQKDKAKGTSTYIPYINEDVMDLINKVPHDYDIKKFDITESKLLIFNKYREILNQIQEETLTNKSFIETFRPFLVFYKSLPEFSKTTKQISERSIKLREAITKSIDPEEAFFSDFPSALGLNLNSLNDKVIEDYAITLKECIHELNNSYDRLINEIEQFMNIEVLGQDLEFPHNKKSLQKRYEKLKKDLIKPSQKVFYNRVVSLLDDRKSWINSITQACIGKSLENISDSEISILKNKIIENIRELDNYTEISIKDIDTDKEEVIKLEITSFLKGLSKKYIRIPKSKIEKINTLERSFKEQLSKNDKTFNIALLTKLLQDELNEEES
jgi:hypothetical protein